MELEAEPAPAPARVRLRFAAFVAVVLFLELGPITLQLLQLASPARGWRMFHSKATDICDVDFVVRHSDGSEEKPSVESLSRSIRAENRNREGSGYRLETPAQVQRVGRAYCKANKGIELRAWARCGHAERGWVPAMDGTEDLCTKSK
jgi:hypothetical protein